MKPRKLKAVASAFVATGMLAAFASCGGAGNSGGEAAKGKTLNITGSSSVFPLMTALADAYIVTHKDVKIDVVMLDSGTGIKDAQEGLNDFGMASRDLKKTETGVVCKRIATDGIAVVVKPGNAVSDVTSRELYDLYANGTPVQSVLTAGITRESGSGTRDAFGELIKNANGDALKKLPTLASVISQQNSTDGVKTEIAKNENLVGYISMGSLDSSVKALSFEGVAATIENIVNGTYALSRPFNIVYRSEASLGETAKAFIAYIMSEEGQAIVEKEGYVKAA